MENTANLERCAYSKKENGKAVWCKFHLEAVNDNKVCDDFLDYLDSPVMSTLLKSETKKNNVTPPKLPISNRIKDICAWFLIIFFILAAVLVFLYF